MFAFSSDPETFTFSIVLSFFNPNRKLEDCESRYNMNKMLTVDNICHAEAVYYRSLGMEHVFCRNS